MPSRCRRLASRRWFLRSRLARYSAPPPSDRPGPIGACGSAAALAAGAVAGDSATAVSASGGVALREDERASARAVRGAAAPVGAAPASK